MNTVCSNMPDIVTLEEYSGNYFEYEKVVYERFLNDFVKTKPVFKGQELSLKRHPLFKNKEATFWHITSEGMDEETRTPDIRRLERISWPKRIIEYCSAYCSNIKVWENLRKGEKRILLWCEDIEYLVVLADRNTYTLIWTAYPVQENHKKRKLQKEYENCIKSSSYKKANAV